MAVRVLAAAVFVLVAFSPASAQTKLFVLLGPGSICSVSDCEPSYVMEIDVDGRRILANSQVLNARIESSEPAITSDGRYLFWSGRESPIGRFALPIFDNVAHATATTIAISNATIRGAVYAHPSKVRAYVLDAGSVRLLEPSRQESFDTGCPFPRFLGLSGDGTRFLTHCIISAGGDSSVFDSETGALVNTLPNTPYVGTLNAAGTEVITVKAVDTGVQIDRYDVATRSILQTAIVGRSGDTADRVVVDPRAGRLYVSVYGSGSTSAVIVIDPSSLEELVRFPLPLATFSLVLPRVVFSSDSARAYVVASTRIDSAHSGTQLTVIDTERLTVEAEAGLPARTAAAGIAIAPKPPQPQNLTSTITGREVTVAWAAGSAPGMTTGYVLEVGFTPGATDLTFRVPAITTTYTAVAVPPGTYYVRVRAANAVTLSAASNEAAITVR